MGKDYPLLDSPIVRLVGRDIYGLQEFAAKLGYPHLVGAERITINPLEHVKAGRVPDWSHLETGFNRWRNWYIARGDNQDDNMLAFCSRNDLDTEATVLWFQKQ